MHILRTERWPAKQTTTSRDRSLILQYFGVFVLEAQCTPARPSQLRGRLREHEFHAQSVQQHLGEQ